ncbi:MAG: C-terminal binding protein, partial [Proteobacteria bacterium]|nr:C-terminal binding protein [Pseudomonadota bacterium]
MTKFKVVVVSLGYESYEVEQGILGPLGAEVVPSPVDCRTEEQVITAAMDADAILVREAPVSAKVVDALSRCKVIARYGIGVDNIDLEAATRKGIYVTNVPEYGTEEVSDHAVALLLASIRTLVRRDQRVRRGESDIDIHDPIYRTRGKTLGLIGYGKIARALHRKWKGFLPSKVLVYDPYVSEEEIQRDEAENAGLDDLLSESDYVSLHVPLTPQTRHLIREDTLKRMKRTAIVVNTSRGAVIDEAALVRALREGWILGAGLDVFEREPLPEDHPLKQLDNVILTDHVG